mgnify:CR=1 FL=1
MLKLSPAVMPKCSKNQPPSGGCVLKPIDGTEIDWDNITQPPSGGCVLKRSDLAGIRAALTQPPSGGCVLKLKRW